MRRRLSIWAGSVLAVALAAVWLAGELAYPGVNPPHRYRGTVLSAQSDPVLRRACFDCHSHETRHPWYRHLPVAGLVMAQHIRNGREELNFSMWDVMPAEQRAEAIHEMLEAVQEREMPTVDYVLLHPQARLSDPQVAALQRDALTRYGVRAGADDGDDGHDGRDDD